MTVSNDTNVLQQQAVFQCYVNEISFGPIVEVTKHYCGVIGEDYSFSSSISLQHTCMCSGDSCNSAMYLPGSNPPPETTEGGENGTESEGDQTSEGSGVPVPTKKSDITKKTQGESFCFQIWIFKVD